MYMSVVRLDYSILVVVVPRCPVAEGGRDALALHIFHCAGLALGSHVRALVPKAQQVRALMSCTSS